MSNSTNNVQKLSAVNGVIADNTGVAPAATSFQAVIDATPNSGVQMGVVPAGTYNVDMSALNLGSRSMVWLEQGGVSYTVPPARGRAFYNIGGTPSFNGDWRWAKDTSTDARIAANIRIQRDANHTGALGTNPAALQVVTNIGQNVTNKENACTFEINCNSTTHAASATAFQAEGRKTVVGSTNLIVTNAVAKDETTRQSSTSLGSCIALEAGFYASGPDNAGVGRRFGLDIIGGQQAASGDGATTLRAGVRIRNANIGAGDATIVHGIEISPDRTGTGGITNGITINDANSNGLNVYGNTTIAINAVHDNTAPSVIRYGSERVTNGQVIAQQQFTGGNSAGGAQVVYARIDGTIQTNTAAAENGSLTFYTARAGAVTAEAALNGGMILGAPVGGHKGVGSLNVSVDIYKNNTAYTNPDYVFEKHYTGDITLFADKPGADKYTGLKSIDEIYEHTKTTFRLPGFTDKPAGMFERADMLLEKLEEAYLLIFQLHDTNKDLAARIAALEAK